MQPKGPILYFTPTIPICLWTAEVLKMPLIAVYKWFWDNRLTLNISNSSFTIYHRKGRRMHDENFSLEINNVNLERVKSVKFLGVILDDHPSWEHHVNGVTSRISKLIPLIYQVRDKLSSSSLRQIYFALIYPSLTFFFCFFFWGTLFLRKLYLKNFNI